MSNEGDIRQATERPLVVIDDAVQITPRLSALPVTLKPVDGSRIDAGALIGAHALITRTVTRVDKSLLDRSDVRFVGAASAGTDHVDTDYLMTRGIVFANSAGCNASAVSDYVLAAIALCGRLPSVVAGAEIGVLGYGHVGRRVARVARALGARVKVHDPWVNVADIGIEAVSLEALLSCSIISLHAALHAQEPFPSIGLIDTREAGLVAQSALFINAGRGDLVTQDAVTELLKKGVDVVLDTWPNEPAIASELLTGVRYATPHIAGYSRLAKQNATDFLITPLIHALGLRESAVLPSTRWEDAGMTATCSDDALATVSGLIARVGRLDADDRHFRAAWAREASALSFESQRRDYVMRDQLEGLHLSLDNRSEAVVSMLSLLGVLVAH